MWFMNHICEKKCEKFWYLYGKWFEWECDVGEKILMGYQFVIVGQKNFGEYKPYFEMMYYK